MTMPANRSVLLRAEHLTKHYGSGGGATAALRDVSLNIYDGELLVILGSSGSGKSTLLNLLGGMDSADSGSIAFNGRDLCTLSDRDLTAYRRESVGFVFQQFHLIAELTARENITLLCADKSAADAALKAVGLTEKADRYPSELSGGEQQRVSIARAIVRSPRLLLCDEPTGALDYETGRQILRRLEQICREGGRTVVIVTHTREIGRMADRVVELRSGKLIKETVNRVIVPAKEIEW